MTPEQKAKVYDEALEKASTVYKDGDKHLKATLENIFPELQESEDEKIREWLVEHQQAWLHDQESGRYMDNKNLIKSIKKSIEWLEKQGETYKDKESYELAEKEKYDFVSGKFIQCKKSFNEFKENNNYWLEYVGNDTYIGRSDNILNKKFHITPRQLYQLFTQPKENNVNEETNAPTAYGKYVDECLNDATKHFFSEGEDKYSVADLFYAGVRCGQSWVEKQRGNNNQNWEPSEEPLEASEYLENKNEQKNKINSYKIAVEITYEDILVLECAMKTIDLTGWDGANELYEKIVSLYNKIHNAYLLQLQDEQKSSVKAEPKFHEGEWITNGERTWFVEGVHNGFYDIISPEGHRTDDTIIHVDEYFHLWTIQDAKGGDILAYNDGHGNDCIELIKSITDKKIEFWFCLTNGNDYEVFGGITPYTNFASREDATPATKEQCDLFFQKMEEAGYGWDTEKKKLKIINWSKHIKCELNSPSIIEKPADKAEPKFHEGEWCIDNEDNTIFQITKVLSNLYYYRTNEGKEYSCSRDSIECDAHLWTINDAKDGDVLCYEDEMFILKYYALYLTIVYHCCYDGKNFIPHSIYSLTKDDFNKIHPATKEQRDILFQKMKEAGYEWNSEKRELRKIEHEQNPADKSEVKFKGGDWVVNGK